MRPLRRIAATTAAALVAALGTVIPAGVITAGGGSAHAATSGGTIVFIKNHNVWVARGDGSGQTQITSDGRSGAPYAEPSMSDNGRIAVMKDDRILVINQSGKVLTTMSPDDLFIEGAGTTIRLTPILEPTISPDGTRVAYSQVRTVQYAGSSSWTFETLTGLSRVRDGADDLAGGLVEGSDPAWLTNSRLLLSDGDVSLHVWGSDDEPRSWFVGDDVFNVDEWNYVDLAAPTLSASGDHIAFLGAGGNVIGLADVTGDPLTSVPAPPAATCMASEEGEVPEPYLSHYERPSFGPSDTDVVFEQYGNIHKLSGFTSCDSATKVDKIINGGTDPDWSTATYDPGKPGSSGKALKNTKAPTIKGKAKVGKKLKATSGSWSKKPSKVTFRWLRNGKAIKGAKGAKKKYKVVKRDRGKKISVRVVAKRSGFKSGKAASKAVKIKK